MSSSLTHALLTGALVASLGWNVWSSMQRCERPALPGAGGEGCLSRAGADGECGQGSCEIDSEMLKSLDISTEQRARLEKIWQNCGTRSGGHDRRATELLRELTQALSQPELDAAHVRELARSIGEERARAVQECADSVLQVREILSADQTSRLLQCCGGCEGCR